MSSLLEKLPYREYEKALGLTRDQCDVLVKFAGLNITFNNIDNPGEQAVKALNQAGKSVEDYNTLLSKVLNAKIVTTYYKPQSKVAVLIANADYIHLGRLATPIADCESLAAIFQRLGFITIIVSNTTSTLLKKILQKIVAVIPENSYCFIFYAGHGCEICNTKCMLGINAPKENIALEHCVTENLVLDEVATCKPELCLMIMDMCRITLDRISNPKIFTDITSVENYSIHNNLLVCSTTKGSASAYEAVEMAFTNTTDIPESLTYALQSGDSKRIIQGTSQYAKALYKRLEDDLDISTLLDKVHEDVENAFKKQTPIKVQCGIKKRSLYDIALGDIEEIRNKIKSVCEEYTDYCRVDYLLENDTKGTTVLLEPK